MIRARRIGTGPLLSPASDPSLGGNLNGPSVLPVPEPLRDAFPARWMMAFAHHMGRHLRLALADRPEGPWRVVPEGLLRLEETPFPDTRPAVPQPAWAVAAGVDGLYPHIASPDLHWDAAAGRLGLWYHGLTAEGGQATAFAETADGRGWQVGRRYLTDETYLRVFAHGGRRYALAVGGTLLGEAAAGGFDRLCQVFDRGHRHAGVLVRGGTLWVAWTRIGDAPERILLTPVTLAPGWRDWRQGETMELLRPEAAWEGAETPVAPSRPGAAPPMEHALRDPFLFEDGDRVLMAYAAGGESALGLAAVEGI